MRNNHKLLNCLFLTLGVISFVGCTPLGISSSHLKEEIKTASLKEGLQYLNTKKNYTFQCDNGSYSTSVLFDENSIGYKFDGHDEMQVHYIQDKKGIYSLTYENKYLASEYLKDEENVNYTSIWDNSFCITLLGVETDYINSIDEALQEITITNKTYKMHFIQALGYSDTDYLNVEYLKCSYVEDSLQFELKILKGNSLIYKLKDLNVTYNEDVEKYIAEGGQVYTPNEDLSAMRTLLRSNNFSRDIYDINEKTFNGIEIFNPHYFYSEIYSYGSGSGAMPLVQKANSNHNFDLYGCYQFTTTGSIKRSITGISFYPNPSYEEPDVISMFHYPTFLSILDNLQYMQEGFVEGAEYVPNGDTYVIENMTFIYDFIKNFSFDQVYNPTDFKPYRLAVDLEIYSKDKDSRVTFIYFFTYNNSLYEVIVPLYNFNNSNVEFFENVYAEYNS